MERKWAQLGVGHHVDGSKGWFGATFMMSEDFGRVQPACLEPQANVATFLVVLQKQPHFLSEPFNQPIFVYFFSSVKLASPASTRIPYVKFVAE